MAADFLAPDCPGRRRVKGALRASLARSAFADPGHAGRLAGNGSYLAGNGSYEEDGADQDSAQAEEGSAAVPELPGEVGVVGLVGAVGGLVLLVVPAGLPVSACLMTAQAEWVASGGQRSLADLLDLTMGAVSPLDT
jgi:hypothetical protein